MTLATRDALLSRLAGVVWPAGPLLDTLNLSPLVDVLDIGAGAGSLLREWRKRGHAGRLVGVDPEPGADILTGVAEALPFPAQDVDVVLMIRLLSHLPRPALAVREAQRVLRPGGRLVMAVNGAEHLQATWQAVGRPAGDEGPDAVVRHALREASLVALRLDVRLPVTVTAVDADELMSLYGLNVSVNPAKFPLQDDLHLAIYQAWVKK